MTATADTTGEEIDETTTDDRNITHGHRVTRLSAGRSDSLGVRTEQDAYKGSLRPFAVFQDLRQYAKCREVRKGSRRQAA